MKHYEIAQMVEELVRIGLDTEAIAYFVDAAIREIQWVDRGAFERLRSIQTNFRVR